jgi:hypothetical protein
MPGQLPVNKTLVVFVPDHRFFGIRRSQDIEALLPAVDIGSHLNEQGQTI